ncbi:DUF2894 domain-containing protein [Oryzisolibacter sp. LB2S]|uniref:DUF2894 domain-containing protein n=1 Tax=Alicycliphilus soli TaxID=3228789 RepID=UPI0034580BE0
MIPVQQLLMQALARRAATHSGPVRRLLDARLAELSAAQGGAADAVAAPGDAHGDASGDAIPAARATDGPGPLGWLARELARAHAAPTSEGLTAPPQRELQVLQRHRATWTRLSAEERLRQALAQVPAQAGPLNSHHLVHRALMLMQAASPEYLQRFVPYVDALLALEQMQAPPAPAAPTRARRAPAGASRGAARKSRS